MVFNLVPFFRDEHDVSGLLPLYQKDFDLTDTDAAWLKVEITFHLSVIYTELRLPIQSLMESGSLRCGCWEIFCLESINHIFSSHSQIFSQSSLSDFIIVVDYFQFCYNSRHIRAVFGKMLEVQFQHCDIFQLFLILRSVVSMIGEIFRIFITVMQADHFTGLLSFHPQCIWYSNRRQIPNRCAHSKYHRGSCRFVVFTILLWNNIQK